MLRSAKARGPSVPRRVRVAANTLGWEDHSRPVPVNRARETIPKRAVRDRSIRANHLVKARGLNEAGNARRARSTDSANRIVKVHGANARRRVRIVRHSRARSGRIFRAPANRPSVIIPPQVVRGHFVRASRSAKARGQSAAKSARPARSTNSASPIAKVRHGVNGPLEPIFRAGKNLSRRRLLPKGRIQLQRQDNISPGRQIRNPLTRVQIAAGILTSLASRSARMRGARILTSHIRRAAIFRVGKRLHRRRPCLSPRDPSRWTCCANASGARSSPKIS